jgi:hypothetical protein
MTAALAIGTVHPDLIDARFCQCLVTTLTEDTRGYLPFREPVLMARAPAGMIHVARNEVVRAFLAHPLTPTYLLFIDTDMQWTPSQAWDLVDCARLAQVPVVGALYAFCEQERDGPGPVIPALYDERMKLVPVSATLQRVFCAGMGFMLLHRDALVRVGDRYGWPTPWFDYGHRHGKAVSEDVIFSARLAACGIPLHVRTDISVGHRKLYGVRHDTAGAFSIA